MSAPAVVQIITRLIVGGAQLSALRLCEVLRDDGFDVRIVAGPEEGPEGSLRDDAAHIAPVHVLPSLRRDLHPLLDAVAVARLRALLCRDPPAIVHSHSSKAGIVGRIAASRGRSAVVHTVHGWGHTPNDGALRRATLVGLERAVAPLTDALVAVSEGVREEGLTQRIGSPEQYHVIPEFVDYEPLDCDFARARGVARHRLALEVDDEVIGWVGRFVRQKDPETLTDSIIELRRLRPAARVVLVGDGPERGKVETRLRAAGVEAGVSFAGLRTDARELYPAFDVLLHPSLWEGQPRVIQEALAERIPVIASRVTGVTDLVSEGVTGFLAPPRDVRAMVAGANAVLDSNRLRAPLASDDVRRIAEQHGTRAARARHLALYHDLLSRHR